MKDLKPFHYITRVIAKGGVSFVYNFHSFGNGNVSLIINIYVGVT